MSEGYTSGQGRPQGQADSWVKLELAESEAMLADIAERTARAEAGGRVVCQACTERVSQRPLSQEEERGEMMHRRNRKQVG